MAIEICMTEAGIGDCILIRCGKSEKKVNILIDSGQGENVFDSVLRRVLRNEEKVDLLILTHDDNDHVKGACKFFCHHLMNNEGLLMYWTTLMQFALICRMVCQRKSKQDKSNMSITVVNY